MGGAPPAGIGKAHAFKRDRGLKRIDSKRRRGLADHRLGIHQLEDRLRGRLRQHAVVHERAHVAQRPVDLDPEHQHHQQHAKTHLTVSDPKGAEGKRHRDPKRDPGIGDAAGERVGRQDPHGGFKKRVGGVFEFAGAGSALAKSL